MFLQTSNPELIHCTDFSNHFCCFFKTFFKVCCSLAVVLMISYWILKYSQDEDLCLVDYISIQEVKEESLPVLSVCFYHPFIEDKFKLGPGQRIDLLVEPNNLSKIEFFEISKELNLIKVK